MASKRILIVEDEQGFARVLKDNLTFEGYDVQVVGQGCEALAAVDRFDPDLVILDLMLPGLDGFEVCRRLASRPRHTPIIIVSARSQDSDKIRGLELGADDYVTKPFSIGELLARIRAVLRRFGRGAVPATVRFGDVRIDFEKGEVSRAGKPVAVTQRELELLRFLSGSVGETVTRDELLHAVWGYRDAPLTRTVDNFMARLRHKLEPDPRKPRFIRTVYGTGYRFVL